MSGQQLSQWLITVFVMSNLIHIGYKLLTRKRIEAGELMILWLLWGVLAVIVTGFYVW